jgi:hypothetical protein
VFLELFCLLNGFQDIENNVSREHAASIFTILMLVGTNRAQVVALPPHIRKGPVFLTTSKNALASTWVISGFRRGVNKVFALLGSYAALIGSYRRFETAYWSHLRE